MTTKVLKSDAGLDPASRSTCFRALQNLAESNFKIENFKQAYIYQVKLKEVNDSVFNVENSKILSDIKFSM